MCPVITDLKPQGGRSQRMGVFVDGSHAFDVGLMQAAPLTRGQELTRAEIEAYRRQDRGQKAYSRAIRFLARRPRSCSEVLDYLQVKGCGARAAESAVSRLVQEKILDDEDFARRWVDWRQRYRPRGRYALQHELRRKGVAPEIIEAALAEVDEIAGAWQAVESKLQSWRHLEPAKFRAKILGWLQRRGFAAGVCYDVCERVRSQMDDPGATFQPDAEVCREENHP